MLSYEYKPNILGKGELRYEILLSLWYAIAG